MTFTYSLYPDNWSELATAIKQQAQWRCQKCGLQCIPHSPWGKNITSNTLKTQSVHATGSSLGQKPSK